MLSFFLKTFFWYWKEFESGNLIWTQNHYFGPEKNLIQKYNNSFSSGKNFVKNIIDFAIGPKRPLV